MIPGTYSAQYIHVQRKDRLVTREHLRMTMSPTPPCTNMFFKLCMTYTQLSASSLYFSIMSCVYILWFTFNYCHNLIILFDIYFKVSIFVMLKYFEWLFCSFL